MKFRVLALATITAALLTGCSGVVTPKVELANHDSDHNIPAIDEMIIAYKTDYINKCYLPVAKKHPRNVTTTWITTRITSQWPLTSCYSRT